MKEPSDQHGNPKRILIVDDHPIFREGITQTINREPGLMVCGEASNAREGLEMVEKLKPDLVVVDITLPGKSGLELIKDLRALRPELPLFVLSMHDAAVLAERALRSGARAYVMKHEPPKRVIEGIKRVLNGQIFVNSHTADRIILSFAGQRGVKHYSAVSSLSDREFEVFRLLGRGHDTATISRELHLSPKTIAVHKANIKHKLAVSSSAELIRLAVHWESEPGHRADLKQKN